MKGVRVYVSKKKNNRKMCRICEKEMALSHFYSSSSPFFIDGKIDFCTKCSLEIVEKEGFEGFQNLMKLINKPIYRDLYKGDSGDYIRQMNSLPQYRGLTYEDSNLFEEVKNISSIARTRLTELSEEELKESEEFWGRGKEEWEYVYLNNEYSEYLNRYDTEDSKVMEDLIEEICLTKLDIRVKRMANQDVTKQLKTLQDLLGSSNLKPAQENSSNSAEHETFGTLIKKWENERPLPEPDPEWKDVNGIRRLIIWFVGHMAEMAGKENPYKEEYEAEAEKYDVFREAMDDDR